jgi:electron transfer flavoprotein beta subunit
MKAKKKPLEEIPISDLVQDLAPKVEVLKMSPPLAREAGRKVESVTELVDALQNEAKVL